MDLNDALLPVSGLLGTLIGGLLVFWTQASQWRRSRRAEAEDREAEAIHALLVKALAVDIHAHQLALAAQVHGSVGGSIAALLGDRGPIDPQTALTAMTKEVGALQEAAAFLWLTSAPETVALASDVALAAADVITAHSGRSALPAILRWILDLLRGPKLGDPDAIAAARSRLAHCRELLASHTRQRFGLPDVPSESVSREE